MKNLCIDFTMTGVCVFFIMRKIYFKLKQILTSIVLNEILNDFISTLSSFIYFNLYLKTKSWTIIIIIGGYFCVNE